MRNLKTLTAFVAPLIVMVAVGCAPAYRCYSGCCVNCTYCPPPPLPYTHYPDCVCHSCAASKYLSVPPVVETPPVAKTPPLFNAASD